MNKIISIMILLLSANIAIFAQGTYPGTPESSSAAFSTTVIEQLAVSPNPKNSDHLWWPTIPVGSKYYIGTNPNEDSDNKSVFSFTGEANKSISITIQREYEIDNVEVSYRLLGTTEGFGGPGTLEELLFEGNSEIVDLSGDGKYYLHIVYDWVWAKTGATPGERAFVQIISFSYNDL